jgi:hypothetical protein
MFYYFGMPYKDIQRQFSLGFDLNILRDSIKRMSDKEPLSNVESLAVENAITFLDMVIKFCDQKHEQVDYGLSSAEAYHFFVGALSSEVNSLSEVKEKAIHFKEQLQKIKSGHFDSSSEAEELIQLFNKMNPMKQQDMFNFDFQRDKVGWEL